MKLYYLENLMKNVINTSDQNSNNSFTINVFLIFKTTMQVYFNSYKALDLLCSIYKRHPIHYFTGRRLINDSCYLIIIIYYYYYLYCCCCLGGGRKIKKQTHIERDLLH